MQKTPNDRPALVFAPGFTCTAALWAPQIAALSDRYACSVADHTRSDTMAGIARDILADAPATFALCGLSMGGYIAFEIMRQAPERVTRLALLDTQATPESDAQRQTRAERIEMARTQGMVALHDLQWPTFVHPSRYEDRALRDVIRKMAVDTGFEVFMRQAKAIMGRADSRLDMAAIRVPTLVLVGAQDALTTPERAHEMAEAIAGAKLVITPECGHISTLERPEAVNAALEDWLGA